MIINKPMLVGDDEGTSAEFEFLSRSEVGEDVDISLASFNGNITYSTVGSQIRADIKDIYPQGMSAGDRELFLKNYNGALKGQSSGGALIKVNGRNKFLQVQTIKNEASCYHCHGRSQPVLGAMAVLQDVEEIL